MIEKAISSLIGAVITGLVGYLTAIIKQYKKRDEVQQEALKCLLRSNLTSKYYVYKELGHMPGYEKENINYMYQQYKIMGGNSYIDEIVKEINQFSIDKK